MSRISVQTHARCIAVVQTQDLWCPFETLKPKKSAISNALYMDLLSLYKHDCLEECDEMEGDPDEDSDHFLDVAR